MDDTWHPFPDDERQRLRALLATPPGDLPALVAVRQQLSGQRLRLVALAHLLDGDADFARRCFPRIVPTLFAHARALLAGASPALALHRQGVSARSVLPRAEVAGWVAHLLLGTLRAPARAHPELDFARLLEADEPSQRAKLRCMLGYFDALADTAPRGRFEIERRVLPARSSGEWLADPAPLSRLTVDEMTPIEDVPGHLRVDFANRYLGGGVLGHGCVQEEILFAVAPELLAAMIVSPVMRDDEAIVLHGAARFSRTRGYAWSLEYAGPLDDPSPLEADGTPDCTWVAIDALDYRQRSSREQFAEAAMRRELDKARAGWRRDARGQPVATGNWGCGAFRGDLPLKAVLQWLAASSEGRDVTYCTFGDARVGPLAAFARAARARLGSVGAAWQRLLAVVDPAGGPALYDRLLA